MKTLPELEKWIAERGISGFWKDERPPRLLPYLWKWSDILEATQDALRLIPGGPRRHPRVLKLRSPGLTTATSPVIEVHVQCLVAGEPLKAHRHTPEAARFIVKGSSKAFTVVDGERLTMQSGDFLTTPRWSWHDHYSEAEEPVLWIDILDLNLATYLQTGAWEPYDRAAQTHDRPDGYSTLLTGRLRPSRLVKARSTTRPAPLIHHSWADAHRRLMQLRDIERPDPFEGLQATFCDPLTGGPTVPTFACGLQLLTQSTRTHRHSSTTICHVVQGAGATIVDGKELHWSKGDIFMVPSMARHRHEKASDDDVIFFFVDDWPVSWALDLYWEEAAD